jgi:hypothetical protein
MFSFVTKNVQLHFRALYVMNVGWRLVIKCLEDYTLWR